VVYLLKLDKIIKYFKKNFRIIVIFVAVFSLVYIFLLGFVRILLINKLKALTHKQVNISSVILKPPLTLDINGLTIQGVGKVERVSLSPSILYLFIGRVAFNKVELVKPEFTYERFNLEVSASNPEIKIEATQNFNLKPKEPIKIMPLLFKHVVVRTGKLIFVDHIADPRQIRVVIRNLNLDLKNFCTYPSKAVMRFNLSGDIPWQPGIADGKIAFKGWVDLYQKSTQADLNVENIDGISLYPYYATWVDLEKARIEKAKLNFKSAIKGVDNNVEAVCRLELTDIVRKPRPPEEPQEKAERITDAVLDMFKSMNQGKVILDFTLHTKMDRPEFGFGNIKSALEGKLRDARKGSGFKLSNALALPGKAIEGGVKGGLDLSRAVFDGIIAVGNGVKNLLENAHKETPAEVSK
jgi:hypothetical protein